MGLTTKMPAEFSFSDIFITKYKSYQIMEEVRE